MFCPNCGTQIPNNSAFCMNCGKPINPSPAQQQSVQQPVYQPPVQTSLPQQSPARIMNTNISVKKSKGYLFALIPLVIVLVGAIIFLCANFFKSDEQKIRDRLDTFSESCNDGDIEEMINCFDKKTRKTYDMSLGLVEGIFGGMTGFDLPIGDMFEIFGMQEMKGSMNVQIDIESIEINGNDAVVKVTLYSEGEAEAEEIIMCKEDDDWYIDLEGTTGQSILY
ncbi:MAG: zinc-ribbon domain-containing protein [Clostridia bacterium]|nr:zinc-ribbon domain-containing protein [Clostridia bacterium]MBR4116457.1 zinc-ribbon domain-containing protein [Clostridia bacterium]